MLRRDEGIGLTISGWAKALLDNSLGRYEDALTAAAKAIENLNALGSQRGGHPERNGRTRRTSVPVVDRDNPGQRHRLGTRHRGPLPRTAQRTLVLVAVLLDRLPHHRSYTTGNISGRRSTNNL